MVAWKTVGLPAAAGLAGPAGAVPTVCKRIIRTLDLPQPMVSGDNSNCFTLGRSGGCAKNNGLLFQTGSRARYIFEPNLKTHLMNRTEFDSRVMSCKDRMYHLVKGILCDGDEAQDAVQDVLERLWVRRKRLGAYGNLDAFILTSVRNACLDRIRSRKIREGSREAVAERFETVTDPRRLQDIADMKALAEKIIGTLPEKQRIAIHMRDVEGMEMEEIAAATGIAGDLLRVYLSQARKAVREKLITTIDYGLRK